MEVSHQAGCMSCSGPTSEHLLRQEYIDGGYFDHDGVRNGLLILSNRRLDNRSMIIDSRVVGIAE